jgi:hypothetical protein
MTKTRVCPEIERNNISPDADIPILEFYNGFYDCIYIILHPFYKVVDQDEIKFDLKTWPTKKEINRCTQKLSWQDFIKLSGIENINRLDIALRNSIWGLNNKHKNDEDLGLFNNATEKYSLIPPGEGDFSDILINEMLEALLFLGYDWIFVGDEFGHERKLQYIQDIIDDEVEVNYHHENWYTPKNEILYTTHWDSHFTMLCSDKRTVEKILEKYPFEGFYCKPDTEIYWSIHSKIE